MWAFKATIRIKILGGSVCVQMVGTLVTAFYDMLAYINERTQTQFRFVSKKCGDPFCYKFSLPGSYAFD